MIRLVANLRTIAGTVAFWRVDATDQVQAFEPVPPPPPVPSGATVADVALAKSEGPIVPSQQLLLQLRGWSGNAPPKPWKFRAVENELGYRARMRATRAAASDTP